MPTFAGSTATACTTGNCDGGGACENRAGGTDCGVCRECDGFGACIDDLSQDGDCGLCEECGVGGTCVNQPSGSDVKAECIDPLFCNGVETCNGSGACQPGSDPCAPLMCDEGNDQCVGCLVDGDCPLCERCSGGNCVPQALGSDLKNECTADACNTGTCNGASACGVMGAGTDCGICSECDGFGACIDDLSQDGDCPLCQECGAGGTCQNQSAGSDVKAECIDGDFCDGVETCNGSGACQPGSDPCAPLLCDEINDVCVGCLVDGDCPLCQECVGGNCQDQALGSDVKNECSADACNTGTCNGAGACGVMGAGTDCGICSECDGFGACVDDLTQDGDCGLCQECAAGGGCQNQGAGSDVKNECAPGACTTGSCNGSGACGVMGAGTDCGICRECNATGTCIDDLSQDGDCGFCEECGECVDECSEEAISLPRT